MSADFPGLRTVRRIAAAGTTLACVWVAAGQRTEKAEVDLAGRAAFAFAVTGSPMEQFHPGAVRRTRVTVANPYPFAIRVRQVDARVTGSSKSRCKPSAPRPSRRFSPRSTSTSSSPART